MNYPAMRHDDYRQKLVERLKRQLKRSKQARELEQPQFRQRRVPSAKIYSRKMKHLRDLLRE